MDSFKGKRICVNCEHATLDTKFANLDLDGRPTIVHCPFSKRSRIRNEQACSEHFKQRAIGLLD